MWWLKIFGSRLNKWLLNKTKYYNAQNMNMKAINDFFVFVFVILIRLESSFCQIIIFRNSDCFEKNWSFDISNMICHSIHNYSLTDDKQYSMRNRMISDDLRDSLDEPLRAATVQRIHQLIQNFIPSLLSH